jgi:hypothetical protein
MFWFQNIAIRGCYPLYSKTWPKADVQTPEIDLAIRECSKIQNQHDVPGWFVHPLKFIVNDVE